MGTDGYMGTKYKHSTYNTLTPKVEFKQRLSFTEEDSKGGVFEVAPRGVFYPHGVELGQQDLCGTYTSPETQL